MALLQRRQELAPQRVEEEEDRLLAVGLRRQLRITAYFTDKATDAIQASALPDELKEQFATGRSYGKLRAITITFRTKRDVEAAKVLVALDRVKSGAGVAHRRDACYPEPTMRAGCARAFPNDVTSKRSLWLLSLAALSTMTAFGRSRGYDPLSLLLYVLVAAGVCLVLLRFRSLDRLTKGRFAAWLLYGAVLAHVAVQSRKTDLRLPERHEPARGSQRDGLCARVLVVLQCPPLFHRIPGKGRAVICALCAATAAIMLLLIPLISPDPAIDVVTVQEEAAASLRAGENPYQKADYTNIYGPRTPWYPDGRMTSYPYPPLTMLAPSIGDPRWVPMFGHLFEALTVFLMGRKTLPPLEGFWLSFLVLYPPNARFVIEQEWTDPNLVLGLSLVALAYGSGLLVPSLLAFGLMFAFKQSMVILVPLVWMLWPALKLRTCLWAAVIPVLTYLALRVVGVAGGRQGDVR